MIPSYCRFNSWNRAGRIELAGTKSESNKLNYLTGSTNKEIRVQHINQQAVSIKPKPYRNILLFGAAGARRLHGTA